VLPFENLSGDLDQDYFADGFTKELTATLGQVSGWSKVISNRTMVRYKESEESPRDIASQVSVRALLSGSIQRVSSNQVKTIVELVDGGTEKLLWTRTFESELRNFSNLKNDITRAIAARVGIALTPTEEARLVSVRPVDPEAYELYLKALHQGDKWNKEAFEKAVDYLQQAIVINPDYAQAYVLLSECYVWFGWSGTLPFEDAAAKARAFTNRAFEIDDMLSESHYALAQIKFYFDWDWAGAEEEYRRAIELNPNNSLAHGELAWNLMVRGRFEEAITEAQRCLQINPISYPPNMSMVWIYHLARQHDKAIAHCRQYAELDPDDFKIYGDFIIVYEQTGQYEEAIWARQKQMTLSGAQSEAIESLSRAYSESGPDGYWLWLLEKWKGHYDSLPAYIAMYYGQLGDKDQAFAWLEKAYENHDAPMFRIIGRAGVGSNTGRPALSGHIAPYELAGGRFSRVETKMIGQTISHCRILSCFAFIGRIH